MAAGPYAQPQVAGLGKRLGAYLLDIVLFFLTLMIGWIIWTLIVWAKGQSPGKQLLGMRCLKLRTNQTATWGTMCLREVVGKMLLGLVPLYSLISIIVLLVDDRHQGLWDKVAGTIVVDG
jgi:uncharacterized RDD family membrane protein YckC